MKGLFFVILGVAFLGFACTILAPSTPADSVNQTAIFQTQVAQAVRTIVPELNNESSPTEDKFEKTKIANQTQNAAYYATLNTNSTLRALTPSATPKPTNKPKPTST